MKRFILCLITFAVASSLAWTDSGVRLATFQVDVTPPLGAPLCLGGVEPVKQIDDPLSARGIVLFPGDELPIVLCAVDWVGIGNSAHDAWRAALATAANTTADRVAVQTLHQHDAPGCDFSVEELVAAQGLGGQMFDVDFAREAIARTVDALARAIANPVPVDAIGAGEGEVKEVASNRRILGDDGKVRAVRWTATKDPEVRAEPAGVIDPKLKAISFWNGDTPVAVLTYYATHPQSHYGQGGVSCDFPGIARRTREEALPGVAHIHFDGAGGNIGAGKWNDGDPANRPVLAQKVADGMSEAWENTVKTPLAASDIKWDVQHTVLPVREEITTEGERARLADAAVEDGQRFRAAREIAFRERMAAGQGIPISRLALGTVQLIHMPGELFVEYQLAAQKMAPGSFVCMAAYGDYGPGYIGTAEAYPQGGYETGLYVSRVSPKVEAALMEAMEALLR